LLSSKCPLPRLKYFHGRCRPIRWNIPLISSPPSKLCCFQWLLMNCKAPRIMYRQLSQGTWLSVPPDTRIRENSFRFQCNF
jgi:hypothetical protein